MPLTLFPVFLTTNLKIAGGKVGLFGSKGSVGSASEKIDFKYLKRFSFEKGQLIELSQIGKSSLSETETLARMRLKALTSSLSV